MLLRGTHLLLRTHISLYTAYISLYRTHVLLYRAHIFLHKVYLTLHKEYIFVMYNKHIIIHSMHIVLYIYIYVVLMQSVNNCYVGNTYFCIQYTYWLLRSYVFLCLSHVQHTQLIRVHPTHVLPTLEIFCWLSVFIL